MRLFLCLLLAILGQIVECYKYTSYQYKIECESKSPVIYPKSIIELQQLVKESLKSGIKLKIIGSKHSITDVICTDGIPIHLKHFNHIKVNIKEETVELGAGLEMIDALDKLSELGVTINHVPSFGAITVGGSISLGAHGSSLQDPNTLSEYLTAVTIIDGNGELQTIKDTDKDFDSFRVSIGLLGIIVSATFKSTPIYKLKMRNYRVNDDLLTQTPMELISKAKKHNWFQFWWYPTSNSLVISEGDKLSVKTPGNAQTNLITSAIPEYFTVFKTALEVMQVSNSTAALNELQEITERALYEPNLVKEQIFTQNGRYVNPAIGYGYKLMMNRCKDCPWNGFLNKDLGILVEESSIGFNIKYFPQVIADLNALFTKFPTAFPLIGIMIRFSKATRGVLSIANNHDTVHIDWAYPMRLDPYTSAPYQLQVMQSIGQLLIFKYNGRPHWGKNGPAFFSNSILSNRYDINKFRRAINRFDPNGVFGNLFSRRLLGIGKDVIHIPDRVKHCAIQEYCFCTKDSDCASFQKCGPLIGYPVCLSANILQPVGELLDIVI